jgi:hypothetical protein
VTRTPTCTRSCRPRRNAKRWRPNSSTWTSRRRATRWRKQPRLPDALRLKPKPNPAEHHLTGPWRVIADNIINPALENPVSTVLTMNPVGGTVAAVGMAKDVAEYGGQKAAELSLPATCGRWLRQTRNGSAANGPPSKRPCSRCRSRCTGRRSVRKVGPMLRAEIPTDAHAPIRAALKNLTPAEVQHALNDPHLGAMTRRALAGEPSVPKVETAEQSALREPSERNLGPSVPQKVRESIRTAYRSALVTPNAEIEGQAPTLADALNQMGASGKRAQHISERRMGLRSSDRRSETSTKTSNASWRPQRQRSMTSALREPMRSTNRSARGTDVRAAGAREAAKEAA